MKIEFTDRESDVMRVLWSAGPATVAQVQARLSDDLAYTTVLTVLRILEGKGYVDHVQVGKSFRYHPLVEEESAQRSALEHLTAKLFRGSTELLLLRLVQDQPIPIERRRRLQELLAGPKSSAKRKGGAS